jgi:hypothetical protein
MSNVSRCPPWFAEIVERENRKLREFMQREMRQAVARVKKEAPDLIGSRAQGDRRENENSSQSTVGVAACSSLKRRASATQSQTPRQRMSK